MCEAVGHPVRSLKRIGFGPLNLGRLPEGHSRRLLPAEIDALRGAAREPGPGDEEPPQATGEMA